MGGWYNTPTMTKKSKDDKSFERIIKTLMQSGGGLMPLPSDIDGPMRLEWGLGPMGRYTFVVQDVSFWVGYRKYPTKKGRFYLVDHDGNKRWFEAERIPE